MENQNEMLVDPKVKKEINEQGFEGDAAVLIGKKAEMAQMEERLEQEGSSETLGTYVKMHKEIVLPIDWIRSSNDKENILKNIGLVFKIDDEEIYYIDKDGNVAKVVIDPTKISSFKNIVSSSPTPGSKAIAGGCINMNEFYNLMKQEFKDLGLNEVGANEKLPSFLREQMSYYNHQVKYDLKNKKKQEFDL